MIGVNEKENRGTPTGRFTKETYDRGFPYMVAPEHLRQPAAASKRGASHDEIQIAEEEPVSAPWGTI
jgi:hypothetical protein